MHYKCCVDFRDLKNNVKNSKHFMHLKLCKSDEWLHRSPKTQMRLIARYSFRTRTYKSSCSSFRLALSNYAHDMFRLRLFEREGRNISPWKKRAESPEITAIGLVNSRQISAASPISPSSQDFQPTEVHRSAKVWLTFSFRATELLYESRVLCCRFERRARDDLFLLFGFCFVTGRARVWRRPAETTAPSRRT